MVFTTTTTTTTDKCAIIFPNISKLLDASLAYVLLLFITQWRSADVFTFKRDRLALYDEGFQGHVPVVGESVVGQELVLHRLLQVRVIEQFIEHVHELHNEAAAPANTMTS